MPGVATFTLTDDAWQKTMGDYIRVSSKDAVTAMNRTMNSFAIFGAQESDVAQKEEIERVQTLDWWPKYVATVMVKRKAKRLAVRMEKYTSKGKTMSGKMYKRMAELHYTRAEARAQSARMIRGRSVAIGFMRFFFATLSRSMRAYIPGARVPSSKSFKGFDVSIRGATESLPSVSAVVTYPYRRRGEKAVQKAEEMLQTAIDKARPLLIEDMQQYIRSKAQETARSHSA